MKVFSLDFCCVMTVVSDQLPIGGFLCFNFGELLIISLCKPKPFLYQVTRVKIKNLKLFSSFTTLNIACFFNQTLKSKLYIIVSPGKSLVKERGSKFLGFAFSAADEGALATIINMVKNEHPGATHYCFAYMLGKAQEKSRANDDGEPANSAGQPILRQIKSASLTDVLVMVVRYFGGVKLGVPGLIQAYGEAALLAIEDAQLAEVKGQIVYRIQAPSSLEHTVYQLLKQAHVELLRRYEIAQQTYFEVSLSPVDESIFANFAAQMYWLSIERVG